MVCLRRSPWICAAALTALFAVACSHDSAGPASTASATAAAAISPGPAPQVEVAAADAAPSAAQTGGFDGTKAYAQVAKLVSFGPRPPDSDAIRATQGYIRAQLQGFGCAVDADDFHAQTPIGTLAMKNIVAKVPGEGQGIILLLTHYDTLRLGNFVGAEDGGSSTGLMVEIARVLCGAKKPRTYAVWIAFLDGEEAQVVENGVAQWSATDSVYGSRELAARLAVAGDLKRVRAVILADMIGQKGLHLMREENSTKWLADLVWKTAGRLGYGDIFVSRTTGSVSDDHEPFLHRGAPAVDLIDLGDYSEAGYWHTLQDTLDKLSPRNIAIVGHVILESVAELEKR
ncbi:MAG TPA: M28 family peptidase [Candidatus Acidoferrales bacterium]|nr:M28 family peptidase [Candidatus Acidoferrales bacterium]